MTTIKDQVAAEAAIAEREWMDVTGAAMAAVADCFTRREPRGLARGMCEAMLTSKFRDGPPTESVARFRA
ncbi:hypothetical protein [Streptomyces sp. P9-2]|uniref:hypothetical protein n=1 Tax=Streptomyces sp. P9-2 TaxID=3423201 RepID=UPI003F74971F